MCEDHHASGPGSRAKKNVIGTNSGLISQANQVANGALETPSKFTCTIRFYTEERWRAMANATKQKAFDSRETLDGCSNKGIFVDFQLKIVNPKANQAPALWIVVDKKKTPLPLTLGTENTWYGGICADAGVKLKIYAVCRVNKNGTMTLSVKEPGYSFPSVKTKAVDGQCEIRSLPYRVG